MKKPKKTFLLIAVIFLLLLFYASYDIAKRTTFPHRKGTAKPPTIEQKDSVSRDSLGFSADF